MVLLAFVPLPTLISAVADLWLPWPVGFALGIAALFLAMLYWVPLVSKKGTPNEQA